MDFKKLEAMSGFAIVEKLEDCNTKAGPIEVAREDIPYFAKGKVISADVEGCFDDDEVAFIVDNALVLGLGAPPNIFVVKAEDIVCVIDSDEEEEEAAKDTVSEEDFANELASKGM